MKHKHIDFGKTRDTASKDDPFGKIFDWANFFDLRENDFQELFDTDINGFQR